MLAASFTCLIVLSLCFSYLHFFLPLHLRLTDFFFVSFLHHYFHFQIVKIRFLRNLGPRSFFVIFSCFLLILKFLFSLVCFCRVLPFSFLSICGWFKKQKRMRKLNTLSQIVKKCNCRRNYKKLKK